MLSPYVRDQDTFQVIQAAEDKLSSRMWARPHTAQACIVQTNIWSPRHFATFNATPHKRQNLYSSAPSDIALHISRTCFWCYQHACKHPREGAPNESSHLNHHAWQHDEEHRKVRAELHAHTYVGELHGAFWKFSAACHVGHRLTRALHCGCVNLVTHTACIQELPRVHLSKMTHGCSLCGEVWLLCCFEFVSPEAWLFSESLYCTTSMLWHGIRDVSSSQLCSSVRLVDSARLHRTGAAHEAYRVEVAVGNVQHVHYGCPAKWY